MARRRSGSRIDRQQRERRYRLRARGPRGGDKFIPNSDSDFALMARCFVSYIEQHQERLPVSKEQVANLSKAVGEYRDALAKTMTPRTCGPFATRQKNEARRKAEQVIRDLANLLRPHDSLTPGDRFALNVHKRPTKTAPRECPQVAPVLVFKGTTDPNLAQCGTPGKHILQFGNDFDPASNAKPHGAARLELFVDLVPPTEAIPLHPGERRAGQLWYLRSFTTSRFEVEPQVLSDGTPMRVCYWGRWADAKGDYGPFSKTCVARVEGDQLALPGAQQLPVFDERHRRKNVVGHLPDEILARVVVQSGARHALPAGDDAVIPMRLLDAA